MNELPLNQILCGNCVDVLADFPENSIDLVVTDPPYGLSFMGKDWDKTLPPREAFDEIIRVLKPGALAFVMSSPRQDLLWRMLSMLEGVGFELTQSYIDWIYKTGFPKAYDVSKGIDKKLGKIDEREVIGSYQHPDGNPRSAKLGGDINAYGKYGKIDWNHPLTRGESDEAKKWDGWKSKTGLKPAVEMIIQAQKPLGEHQPIFLLVMNLLISLNKDGVDWLKLVALTVDKLSMSNLHTSNEDGANSVHSTVRTNIKIKKFNANSVEKYLKWSNHPNSNSVPINVPPPIIQALVTRLGREVGSSEAMDISQCMSEIGNTASNTILLWKNILVALLLKMSSVTTRTISETITELKILNSLLCQPTSLHITQLKEIIQNGQRFNASTVENCFKGVLSKLKDIPKYSVQGNALENTEIQNLSVNNVEKHSPSSTSMRILESIAHGVAIIKPVPAHEPILMVNKPFSEKTIVDNVLKWGTGAINVEACRIPITDQSREKFSKNWDDTNRKAPRYSGIYNNGKIDAFHGLTPENAPKGRFPANLLVSDKALDTGETTKSGKLEPHHKIGDKDGYLYNYGIYGDRKAIPLQQSFGGDEGSPFRFFDLDAWAKHHGFLDVPKPDTSERDFGLKGKKRIPTSKLNLSDGKNPVLLDGAVSKPRRNIHPTVKPIKLMAYLIELGCPPDGVVLDPFVGSGTTCIAAKQLVRKFIGIELNPEYHALAEARVKAHPVPLSWFDGSVKEDVSVPPTGRNENE